MVEAHFITAAKAGVLCELVDRGGHQRTVEPYMVYRSSRGKRLFHCFQVAGYSKSRRSVYWKNPEVSSFVSATATDTQFRQRPQYNPANTKMFTVIYFSLPKTG
jgi:hypothetical protein